MIRSRSTLAVHFAAGATGGRGSRWECVPKRITPSAATSLLTSVASGECCCGSPPISMSSPATAASRSSSTPRLIAVCAPNAAGVSPSRRSPSPRTASASDSIARRCMSSRRSGGGAARPNRTRPSETSTRRRAASTERGSKGDRDCRISILCGADFSCQRRQLARSRCSSLTLHLEHVNDVVHVADARHADVCSPCPRLADRSTTRIASRHSAFPHPLHIFLPFRHFPRPIQTVPLPVCRRA